MVQNDEKHGSASEEDSQRVQLGVCDHVGGRRASGRVKERLEAAAERLEDAIGAVEFYKAYRSFRDYSCTVWKRKRECLGFAVD